ncbi:MAG: hypothetical protein HY914_08100 [Desulfomonile tiedjei]|nr:hypothetical protein [Desulfomonile tiedjei]
MTAQGSEELSAAGSASRRLATSLTVGMEQVFAISGLTMAAAWVKIRIPSGILTGRGRSCKRLPAIDVPR